MRHILIILLVIFISIIIFHEVTHYVIYQKYGCDNIEFSVDFGGVYTTASCPNDDSDLPQAINEVVGYNIMPVLFFILAAILIKEEK